MRDQNLIFKPCFCILNLSFLFAVSVQKWLADLYCCKFTVSTLFRKTSHDISLSAIQTQVIGQPLWIGHDTLYKWGYLNLRPRYLLHEYFCSDSFRYWRENHLDYSSWFQGLIKTKRFSFLFEFWKSVIMIMLKPKISIFYQILWECF